MWSKKILHQRKVEQGAFIVLFAILLPALIGVIALAIFFHQGGAAREHWDEVGNAACLAGLNGFLDPQYQSSGYEARAAEAIRRASALTALNVVESQQLMGRRSSLQNEFHESSSSSTGRNGIIRFGRWLDGDVCAGLQELQLAECKVQSDTYCPTPFSEIPCFQELSSEHENAIAAVKLDIRISQESPIQHFFAQIFGLETFTVSTVASCAVTPRQMMVLMDLSSSSTRETHSSETGDYSYLLNPYYDGGAGLDLWCDRGDSQLPMPNPCLPWQPTTGSYACPEVTCGENPPRPCETTSATSGIALSSCRDPNTTLCAPAPQNGYPSWTDSRDADHSCYRRPCYGSSCPPPIATCPIAWRRSEESYYLLPNSREHPPAGAGGASHFKDDYECGFVPALRTCNNYARFRNCYQECLDGSTGTLDSECLRSNPNCSPTYCGPYSEPNLLIDTHIRSGYEGARPLLTYFEGLSEFLKIFTDRRVGEDRFGLLGVTSTTLIPNRFFDLTAPGEPRFEQLRQLTDVQSIKESASRQGNLGRNHTPQLEKLLKFGFLPIPPYLGSREGTNIDLGLRHALAAFLDVQDAPAQRTLDVILFTDGISNCFATQFDLAHPPSSFDQDDTLTISCGATVADFNAARIAAEGVVNDYYSSRNVSLHVFLSGSHVKPHHLLLRHGDAFYDSISARGKTTFHFTDPHSATPPNPETLLSTFTSDNPFYEANSWADIAAQTGGIFAPLRSPCCSGESACSEVRRALVALCHAPGLDLRDGEVCTGQLPEELAHTPGVLTSEIIDSSGRVLCDPNGETPTEQVRRYVRAIMGSNPIRLVGPNDLN